MLRPGFFHKMNTCWLQPLNCWWLHCIPRSTTLNQDVKYTSLTHIVGNPKWWFSWVIGVPPVIIHLFLALPSCSIHLEVPPWLWKPPIDCPVPKCCGFLRTAKITAIGGIGPGRTDSCMVLVWQLWWYIIWFFYVDDTLKIIQRSLCHNYNIYFHKNADNPLVNFCWNTTENTRRSNTSSIPSTATTESDNWRATPKMSPPDQNHFAIPLIWCSQENP